MDIPVYNRLLLMHKNIKRWQQLTDSVTKNYPFPVDVNCKTTALYIDISILIVGLNYGVIGMLELVANYNCYIHTLSLK